MSDNVTVLMNRLSIVLLGTFNTSIFQPAWFGREGLLRMAEADAAEIELIHPQLSQFRTDWLELQITRDRFAATSRNGGYEGPLYDLVDGTFTVLSHTPISAIGINREVALQFDTIEQWHRFGDTLVPKDTWRTILPSPGLSGVQIQSPNDVDSPRKKNIVVQSQGPKRVIVNFNDHRAFEGLESTAPMLAALKDDWPVSQQEGQSVIDKLVALVK